MEQYIIGMAGIIGLMTLWVIIQQHWKKAFSDGHVDEDALAGRSDCSNCGCNTPCVNRKLTTKN